MQDLLYIIIILESSKLGLGSTLEVLPWDKSSSSLSNRGWWKPIKTFMSTIRTSSAGSAHSSLGVSHFLLLASRVKKHFLACEWTKFSERSGSLVDYTFNDIPKTFLWLIAWSIEALLSKLLNTNSKDSDDLPVEPLLFEFLKHNIWRLIRLLYFNCVYLSFLLSLIFFWQNLIFAHAYKRYHFFFALALILNQLWWNIPIFHAFKIAFRCWNIFKMECGAVRFFVTII